MWPSTLTRPEITMSKVYPITRSLLFEASASAACDPQGRVWIAWEERGPNWGKDTGAYYRRRGGNLGSTLYTGGVWVRVACFEGGALRYPTKDVTANFSKGSTITPGSPWMEREGCGSASGTGRGGEGRWGPIGSHTLSVTTATDGRGRYLFSSPTTFSTTGLPWSP